MTEKRKAQIMDAYTVVRMVKHAKDGDAAPVPDAGKTGAAPPLRDKPPGSPQHIGHTVQPTKRTIHCFECDYEFPMAGRQPQTHCPKCRAMLDLSDHSIDGEWERDIKTAGTITLQPGGVLKAGVILAHNIVLNGTVAGTGALHAYGWLEIGPSAHYEEHQVKGRDLRIAAGADVHLKGKAMYRNAEIFGTLTADLEASGLVMIKAGGHLKGKVRSEHFCMEDGAGLSARVFIWPKDQAGEPPLETDFEYESQEENPDGS